MTHEFEISEEITLDATPEEVWAAIATGPGVDSWFMGHSEIEQRQGGTNRFAVMGSVSESTITAWDPGRRFAFRSPDAPDGTFMAFEYLIEGRDGGSSVLRFVHNGILGDDWEGQYDGLKEGDPMYLRKLATYLAHFKGRTARHNLFLVGQPVADEERVRSAFAAALSLDTPITEGDAVRFAVPGLPETEGVVEFVSAPNFFGVRSADGILMLIKGYQDAIVVEYHGFSDDEDIERTESAWQTWLGKAFV